MPKQEFQLHWDIETNEKALGYELQIELQINTKPSTSRSQLKFDKVQPTELPSAKDYRRSKSKYI